MKSWIVTVGKDVNDLPRREFINDNVLHNRVNFLLMIYRLEQPVEKGLAEVVIRMNKHGRFMTFMHNLSIDKHHHSQNGS